MKNYYFISFLAILLCALLLGACTAGGSSTSGEANFDKDSSYSLGYYSGMDWKGGGIIPDLDELFQGIKDAYNSETPRFTVDEALTMINEAYMAMQSARTEASRQKEIDFLAQNTRKEGVVITESGLQYEILGEGRGGKPGLADTVRVHYEGSLSDGTVFESTYEDRESGELSLTGIFPGLQEGLQLMSEGASYRFFIPSELAYGSWGSPPVIPPYSTLVFKVDLISIER
jgi:FKBP-type peptidyl-prolyl cis-trans isomerase